MKHPVFISIALLFCTTIAAAQNLSVSFAYPKGDLTNYSDAGRLQIGFDRSLVPLSTSNVKPEEFVSISPAIKGTFRWNSTSVIDFIPDGCIPFGTYTISVKKGVASQVDKSVLAEAYAGTFTMPRTRVTAFSTANDGTVGENQAVYIYFNEPVTIDDVKSHLSIEPSVPCDIDYPRNKGIPYAGDLDWYAYHNEPVVDTTLRRNVIRLRPKKSWPAEETVYLSVKPGVGTSNPSDSEWSTEFHRAAPLEFYEFKQNGSSLRDGDIVHPRGTISLSFNNEVSSGELFKKLRFTPMETFSRDQFESDWITSEPSFGLGLKAGTRYTLTLDTGLTDKFGNKLKTPQTITFTTGDYDQFASTVSGLGVVESKTKRRIPLETVNHPPVTFTFRAVHLDEMVKLLENGDLFRSDSATDFKTWGGATKTIMAGGPEPRNQRRRVPIYLDSILADTCGIAFFEAGPLPNTGRNKGLILVTNIGLTTKFGFDNTFIVTTSLDKGEPLAGTKLEIRDARNLVLWKGITDANGMATAPSWNALGAKRNKDEGGMPSLYVFANRGTDWSIISSKNGTSIDPWRFGVPYSWSTVPEVLYKGTFITDRDLYRPGETMFAKGIVRFLKEGQWVTPPQNRIVVTVEREQSYDENYGEDGSNEETREPVIYCDTLAMAAPGSFEFKLKIPADAKLASYRISGRIVGFSGVLDRDGPSLTDIYSTIRVAEFRPAELEVVTKVPADEIAAGQAVRCIADARYLHGSPVANSPVAWTVRRSQGWFSPEGWDDFGFSDYSSYDDCGEYDCEYDNSYGYGYYSSSEEVASGTDTLDKNGHFEKLVDLPVEQGRGPWECEFQASTAGNSAQSLSGRSSFTVHRSAWYTGIKTRDYIVEGGQSLPISVASIKGNSKPFGNAPITIEVIRRIWTSVRVAGVDGRWDWQSERQDSICLSKTVSTGSNGRADLDFKPTLGGYYVVKATGVDAAGNSTIASSSFYCVGGYVSWARTNDDMIELVPDRKKYSPGDKAQILVKSPFPKAHALVTVEREGIIDRKWVNLNGTAEKISIPITEAYAPNVFVSVVLHRGRLAEQKFDQAGEDLSRPSFKIGYVKLPVSPAAHHTSVSVNPSKKTYQPSDSVSIDISVDTKGKKGSGDCCLMVVDEAVLVLTAYKTPDPFSAFYNERPLSVLTSESRIGVIGERDYGEKGKNRGGGGGMDPKLLAALADAQARSNFKVCAYFNPRIPIPENGKISARFKLPENITTFRVMAVASTADGSFGSGDARILVKKPFMIRPILPRFLRGGDTVAIAVNAENTTGSGDSAILLCKAEGATIIGPIAKSAKIENGQSGRFSFLITAPDSTDTIRVTISGTCAGATDAIVKKIPVMLERLTHTVAVSGSTTDTAREAIRIPSDALSSGVIEARTASTALVGLSDGVKYLFEYPYGCLEQRTSKVLPIIMFEEMVKSFGIKSFKNDEGPGIIREWAANLKNYQTPDGGFDYYPGSTHPSAWVTAYALGAALKAEKKGYAIDPTVKNRALDYVRATLDGTVRNDYYRGRLSRNKVDPWLLAALADAGEYRSGDVERLFRNRDSLTIEAKTNLYKATPLSNRAIRSTLRSELLTMTRVDGSFAYFADPDRPENQFIHESPVRTTGLVLDALLADDSTFALAPKVAAWLMKSRKEGRWASTQENYFAFTGLATYFNAYEKETPDFKAAVSVDSKEWFSELFKGRSDKQLNRIRSFGSLAREKDLPVAFSKDGAGRLYYELRMGFTTARPMPPGEQGFSIKREYFTADGTAISPEKLAVGNTYLVKLTIKNPDSRYFAVINDPIPAGCEIIDTDLPSTDQALAAKVEELRTSGPDGDWYWGTFNYHEFRDSRGLAFANYLETGTHTFCYAMRATLPGTFVLPPALVEEMYRPEVMGRTAQSTAVIRP